MRLAKILLKHQNNFLSEKMEHPLHIKVGELINDSIFPEAKVIKDPACGGNQRIPLFCSDRRSRETEYCNVDLLITVDSKIKVIVEIEEANIKPTQICGKFLTSALSSYLIHKSENNKCISMADSVLFIQILDTSKLKIDKTSKTRQWEKIEASIKNIIPARWSKIDHYKLFSGNCYDFKSSTLTEYIVNFLKK